MKNLDLLCLKPRPAIINITTCHHENLDLPSWESRPAIMKINFNFSPKWYHHLITSFGILDMQTNMCYGEICFKITIQQDLAIFNAQHIPILIALYLPCQKNETLESSLIWLLSNWGRLLN